MVLCKSAIAFLFRGFFLPQRHEEHKENIDSKYFIKKFCGLCACGILNLCTKSNQAQ
jgi:hypothetical protein